MSDTALTAENGLRGVILKGIGGFYYVKTDDGAVHQCRARGRFRLDGATPLPGDEALISPQKGDELGYIEELLPRKNALVRPAVANIDLLLIVLAASRPKPDLLLTDKLLLYAAKNHIDAMICANKTDAADPNDTKAMLAQYRGSGAALLAVSAQTGEGIDALCELMKGKLTCMAGQSAVGKSSLINRLLGQELLATGGLARRTDRGRHTTRAAELLYIEDIDAAVIDTPGFSILETFTMEPGELREWYPEFAVHEGYCRFDQCLHYKEPDCSVKAAVKAGEIDRERYIRYRELLSELSEKYDHRYDK